MTRRGIGELSNVVASVLLVAALLLLFSLCGPGPASAYGSAMENAKERVNLAAEEAKARAAETAQEAKETSESWAGWAREKISEYSPLS